MKINKNFSLLPLISAGFGLVTAIGCVIYGMVYAQYADWAVVLALVVGAVLMAVYTMFPNQVTDWFSLAGTLCMCWGLGLFIVNSYNIWADVNGNLQQYGSLFGDFNFFSSEGGPVPVIILAVLALAAIVTGIVVCFQNRKEAA